MQHNYHIFDAHCDTLSLLVDGNEDIQTEYNAMRNYRGYTQVYACFIPPWHKNCALERCLEMIDLFHRKNMHGIISIEGAEMVTSLAVLRSLYRMGVRVIGLTWNYSNHIASGADEQNKNRGLTEFGKTAVNEMERIGITVDVSHLNDRSFYDVMETAVAPVIASHSNSRAVCAHRRNLTDNMFRNIIHTGGCVGINFYPPFLNESGNADIYDIIRHIEHFMELGGENNIGIGSDFDGTGGLMPKGIRNCDDTYKIFDELLRLNYSEEQIEKISHLNFERIIKNA